MLAEEVAQTPARWPLVARIAFRWFAVYMLLYCLPFPLQRIPGAASEAAKLYTEFWNARLPWFGRIAFGLGDVKVGFQTGSGDTTADFVRMALFATVAALVALLWTVREGQHRAHRTLAVWLLSYVRYVLAVALMGYGIAKVIPRQMPMPDALRLTEMFGELSPMGLLWAFTGYSAAYEIFGGIMELVPGVLLVFRRTALVGAMLAVPVLVNVVLLNFAYDVPVKLYSSHLLVMSAAVIAPNVHRLYGVLVKNCPVAPGDVAPPVRGVWPLRLRALWKAAVLLFMGWRLFLATENRPVRTVASISEGIRGAWNVVSYTGSPRSQPWRSLAIGTYSARIRFANDSSVVLGVARDSARSRVTLSPGRNDVQADSTRDMRLQYDLRSGKAPHVVMANAPDTLHLSGNVHGEAVVVVLVRQDLSKLLLTSRTFHWIQEYPFNR